MYILLIGQDEKRLRYIQVNVKIQPLLWFEEVNYLARYCSDGKDFQCRSLLPNVTPKRIENIADQILKFFTSVYRLIRHGSNQCDN